MSSPRQPQSQRKRTGPAQPRAGEDLGVEFQVAREAFGPHFETLLCLAQAMGPALQRARENELLQADAKALRTAAREVRGHETAVAAVELAYKAAKERADEAKRFASKWGSDEWPEPMERSGAAVPAPLFFIREALKVCPDAPANPAAWAHFAISVGLSDLIPAGLSGEEHRERWQSVQATWGKALRKA